MVIAEAAGLTHGGEARKGRNGSGRGDQQEAEGRAREEEEGGGLYTPNVLHYLNIVDRIPCEQRATKTSWEMGRE